MAIKIVRQYCEVVEKMPGNVCCTIDYGQEASYVDQNNKEFTEAIDAINWLSNKGWQLSQAFGLRDLAHYVMTREFAIEVKD